MNTDATAVGISRRLPSLDGWRAISIIIVLGAHSEHTNGFPNSFHIIFKWLFDGNLGVRFFFVISGFLITWLLILENDQAGRINLKHFYTRRALRILPVYYAFILTLVCLEFFTIYTQSISAWIGNLTFTTNFISDNAWPSGHLWSLSVEEQFYLLLPPMLVFLLKSNTRMLLQILTLPVFIAPICRALTVMVWNGQHCPEFLVKYYPIITLTLKPILSYYSFFNYFDSLSLGCVSAVIFARRRAMAETLLKTHALLAGFIALVLIFVPYVMDKLVWFGSIVWLLGYPLQAIGFSILLLQSIVLPCWGFYRALNWKWICRIGVLSYSIYIWQQLFASGSETFGLRSVWWMSFPGWLVPVFIVAMISFYGFERPLFKLRSSLRKI